MLQEVELPGYEQRLQLSVRLGLRPRRCPVREPRVPERLPDPLRGVPVTDHMADPVPPREIRDLGRDGSELERP